jgi:hypothetical protein
VRTVELHERIECPVLRVIVLLVVVRSTKCPGLEVSTLVELCIIINLGAPLCTGVRIPDTEQKKKSRRRTLFTLKSYPQISQLGARLNNEDSNEDSPLMPIGERVSTLTIDPRDEKKRRTKRVDDAFFLLSYPIHSADPLAAIAECTDAFHAMGTLECRDEKVP